MKVLVADDEAVSRLRLQSTLAKLGYEPIVCDSGAQAWNILTAAESPRLALFDWSMPSPNGPELCRKLRARQGAPYVYVILVTSKSATEDRVEGLDAGADDLIGKPYDTNELRARLRSGQRILQLEGELQRSQSYLAAVLANIDDGVLLSSADGRIVFVNAALTKMAGASVALGATRADLLRAYESRLTPGADFHAIASAQADATPRAPVDLPVAVPQARVHRWSVKPVVLEDADSRSAVGQLDVVRDVTGDANLAGILKHQALTDFLTSVGNRRAGEQALIQEVERTKLTHRPFSLVILDIDHFKRVNDVLGHAGGDAVLQRVATVVQAAVRNTDVVARWGGEEFLVVLPGVALAQAQSLATRIRVEVADVFKAEAPPVTISAGVAEYDLDESSALAAVARADAKLYAAKQAGRNCVL